MTTVRTIRDPSAWAGWVAAIVVVGLVLAVAGGLGALAFLMLDRGLTLRSPAVLAADWRLRAGLDP